ncbi:hypothetical protein D9M72_598430 [compost metagenome]
MDFSQDVDQQQAAVPVEIPGGDVGKGWHTLGATLGSGNCVAADRLIGGEGELASFGAIERRDQIVARLRRDDPGIDVAGGEGGV